MTSIDGMFSVLDAFNQDVGGWDTSRVTSLNGIFSEAAAFNQDVGGWDKSQATTLYWGVL